MCVIVTSSNGKMPSNADLLEMERSNPDGVGLAWHDGEYLRSHKALTLTELEESLRKAEGCPYVLHFRFATHGEVAVENCHPFWLGQTAVLAHNGIIKDYGSEVLSDTRDYINRRLPQLIGDYRSQSWTSPDVIEAIETDIGTNKFAILDVWGDIAVINRKLGVTLPEYPDLWFSNDNWQWHYRGYNQTRIDARYYGRPKRSGKGYGYGYGYYGHAYDCGYDYAHNLGRTATADGYPIEDMPDIDAEPESYRGHCDFCSEYDTLHYLPIHYRDKLEENYLCRECFGEWMEELEP